MSQWDQLPDKEVIEKTIEALRANGVDVKFIESSEETKKLVLELIPDGAEVMTMSSTTLDTLGLSEEINKENSKFKPVRDKLYAMDRTTQAKEMNRLGAAPGYAIGSVHAITEEGHLLIASNTGSQLPAYAYGALKVIWVAGAQKIVKNTEQGLKRIYEHSLPLESERAKKAYGVPGSAVNKILIINKEVQPDRATLILVNEVLGF